MRYDPKERTTHKIKAIPLGTLFGMEDAAGLRMQVAHLTRGVDPAEHVAVVRSECGRNVLVKFKATNIQLADGIELELPPVSPMRHPKTYEGPSQSEPHRATEAGLGIVSMREQW